MFTKTKKKILGSHAKELQLFLAGIRRDWMQWQLTGRRMKYSGKHHFPHACLKLSILVPAPRPPRWDAGYRKPPDLWLDTYHWNYCCWVSSVES